MRNKLQAVAGQGRPKGVRDGSSAVVVQFRVMDFVLVKCVPKDANIEARIVGDLRKSFARWIALLRLG